jgi:hypothetical protein
MARALAGFGMGEVIRFARDSRRGRKRREGERPARILFFTGIRYERFAEPKAAFDQSDSGAPPAGGIGGGRRKRRG